MENNVFLETYLSRIGIKENLEPNLENLKTIQMQHLMNIPFENLDIFFGRKLELNPDSLFDKIIKQKRGGICYELNGIFLRLLKEIGYDAKYVSAKVREEGTYQDHMMVVVEIEKEKYLVDVGFNDNYLYPIKIIPDIVQKNYRNNYKIKKINDEEYELIKIANQEEKVVYTFTTEEKHLNQFVQRCEYFQVTPNTYFTKNPFSAIETEDGKIFITDKKLTVTKNNNKKTREIKDEKEFYFYLEKIYNIKLNNHIK